MEDERKHVHEPMVQGEKVEKSKFEKALSIFLAEDVNTVSESIMDDFIKPRLRAFGRESLFKLREFVADSIIGCVQMIIFGDTSKRGQSQGGSYYTSSGNKVSYTTYYNGQPVSANTNYASINYISKPDTDEYGIQLIKIPSYGNAQEVLGELIGFTKRYKYATIADFYQLVDVTPSKTDWNYGWFDLLAAKIVPYKGGYVIEFPRPIAIE